MYKRWLFSILAACLLPCLFLPAQAAETGSLRVTLEKGAMAAGSVDMYRVAEIADGGYRIYDSFGGGLVREDDARSPHLAQWLGEMVSDQNSFHSTLDATGSATFTDLGPGLYLLVQNEARDGIRPYLVPLPLEGEWALQAYPQSMLITTQIPATGDFWGPIPGILGMALSSLGLIACFVMGRKGRKT